MIQSVRSELGGTPSMGGRCFCGAGGNCEIPASAATAAARRYRMAPARPHHARRRRQGPPHRSRKHFPVSRLPPSSPLSCVLSPHCRVVPSVFTLRAACPASLRPLPWPRGFCRVSLRISLSLSLTAGADREAGRTEATCVTIALHFSPTRSTRITQ